jgi:hypothetical protein
MRNMEPTTLSDERARTVDRALVRTWCMRGTFHLIASEDTGWLLALLGPVLIAKAGRWRRGPPPGALATSR